ncbi:MAG: hypothetical protein WBL63_13100 [Candidatus Acidiferrum sp.]
MRRPALIPATFVALALLAAMVWSGYRLHMGLGLEDLSAWGLYLTGTGTVLVGLMAVYAAVQGVKEYRNRTRTERMRWLEGFYERFYENTRFRVIRQLIDFDDFHAILLLIEREKLSEASFDQLERNLFDDFTDYLNFFEMLLYLRNKGQILEEELESMFGYYLRSLKLVTGAEEVLEYLQRAKFRNLHEFLVNYR